jgi:hypothetical protein
MTVCLVHPDSSPSLRLTLGRNSKWLAHCFAGCDWRDVRDAQVNRGLDDELWFSCGKSGRTSRPKRSRTELGINDATAGEVQIRDWWAPLDQRQHRHRR